MWLVSIVLLISVPFVNLSWTSRLVGELCGRLARGGARLSPVAEPSAGSCGPLLPGRVNRPTYRCPVPDGARPRAVLAGRFGLSRAPVQ